MKRKGAEEARTQLPDLLDAAARGEATVISRHGKPVAALVPITAFHTPQHDLTSLAGSGRGLWGKSSRRTLKDLRDEWSR